MPSSAIVYCWTGAGAPDTWGKVAEVAVMAMPRRERMITCMVMVL